MTKGSLIVIVAPSGTGKSTLIKRLKEEVPELSWSVSCTTRPRRPGEEEGINYFYISKEDFLERVKQSEFVEWATVHSNFYGTLKSFVDQGIENQKYLLFDLDVQGVDQVKSVYGERAKVIYISPPSLDELERRLRKRGTESEEAMRERLENAKKELERKDDFDYLVINDDLEKAYADLKSIVLKLVK